MLYVMLCKVRHVWFGKDCMSNREHFPDSYLHCHLAADQSLIDAWRIFCVLL